MTTVTLDTLSNTGTIFLRDVLRTGLTDRQSPARAGTLWIFKGQPEKRTIDYPYVVLEGSKDVKPITGNNLRKKVTNFRLNLEVWANKLVDRSVLADEIIKIFSDSSSADANSHTMGSKHIHLKDSSEDDRDEYKTDTELVRVVALTLNFSYGGA